MNDVAQILKYVRCSYCGNFASELGICICNMSYSLAAKPIVSYGYATTAFSYGVQRLSGDVEFFAVCAEHELPDYYIKLTSEQITKVKKTILVPVKEEGERQIKV